MRISDWSSDVCSSDLIDPMHQFMIEPLVGTDHLSIGGYNIAFTNSALWMLIAAVALWIFMLGGMKRELVPGRWQAAVESMTSFISNMMRANIGEEGRRFTPYVRSEEHTSELQSLMRISYAVFCLKKKKKQQK